MHRSSWITRCVVAAAAFCVLDAVWLGVVADDRYAEPAGVVSAVTHRICRALPAWAR